MTAVEIEVGKDYFMSGGRGMGSTQVRVVKRVTDKTVEVIEHYRWEEEGKKLEPRRALVKNIWKAMEPVKVGDQPMLSIRTPQRGGSHTMTHAIGTVIEHLGGDWWLFEVKESHWRDDFVDFIGYVGNHRFRCHTFQL